jgi:hypothetical protein
MPLGACCWAVKKGSELHCQDLLGLANAPEGDYIPGYQGEPFRSQAGEALVAGSTRCLSQAGRGLADPYWSLSGIPPHYTCPRRVISKNIAPMGFLTAGHPLT